MPPEPIQLRLPDFEMHDAPITACTWYAKQGQLVIEGERLIEVLAGDVTIDLPAPGSGILSERCVEIDEPLCTNQLLAVIHPA